MDSRRSLCCNPALRQAQRKQRSYLVCKDACAVHADPKTGVIELPTPQRPNALENFGLLGRRVLVQPILEPTFKGTK